MLHPATKFHGNWFSRVCAILLTGRQTKKHRQTNKSSETISLVEIRLLSNGACGQHVLQRGIELVLPLLNKSCLLLRLAHSRGLYCSTLGLLCPHILLNTKKAASANHARLVHTQTMPESQKKLQASDNCTLHWH